MKCNCGRVLVLTTLLLVVAGAFFQLGCPPKGDIKIGAVLPLSGDAATYGASIKKGIDLAIRQVNAEGGVGGRKIAVLYEDSKASPSDGVTAFQKLVDVNKVTAVIGDAVSSVTLAIAPVAQRKRVVVLSPLSSAPAITDAGDFIFRNVPSDFLNGRAAAYFAVKDQGWKKLAVLFINNDFGTGLNHVFSSVVSSLGGQVVASESYEQGATDFRTQLLKIKSSQPDAVFLVGYKEAPQILIQEKELGLAAKFIGTGLLEDPNVVNLAKGAAEGVYFTQLPFDASSTDSVVKRFVNDFTRLYGSKPDIISAYGYDAANILAHAMAGGKLTADALKDALYGTKDFPGVTGSVTFDKNGDVLQPMGVKIIKNGSFEWYKKQVSVE